MADRPRSVPSSSGHGGVADHSHYTDSAAGAARDARAADWPPRRPRLRSAPHEIPASPESTYQSRCDPTHPPSLFAHQEKMTPGGPVPSGIALSSRPPSRPAHPKSGPRRRPGISSDRCTQTGEQPENGGLLPTKRRNAASRGLADSLWARWHDRTRAAGSTDGRSGVTRWHSDSCRPVEPPTTRKGREEEADSEQEMGRLGVTITGRKLSEFFRPVRSRSLSGRRHYALINLW